MAKTISNIFLLLFFFCECVFSQSKFLPLDRLSLQPNGNYAAMFFDEDALGVYCAVLYYNVMSAPLDGAWKISERVWQDPIWSSDITGIAWSPNGKFLYIAASRIYGEGGLFRLKLKEKTYVRVLPEIGDSINNDAFLTTIERIDENTGTLFVTVESVDDKKSYHKTSKIIMDSAP